MEEISTSGPSIILVPLKTNWMSFTCPLFITTPLEEEIGIVSDGPVTVLEHETLKVWVTNRAENGRPAKFQRNLPKQTGNLLSSTLNSPISG